MKNFDINRFGKLLVWTALDNKKDFLMNIATLFIFYFGFSMLPTIISFNGEVNPNNLETCIDMSFMVLFVFAWLGGGNLVFKNMKTKEERITYKMLPATDLEKWTARIIYTFFVCVVASFLTFVVADVLRMGLYQLFYGDYYQSATAKLWSNIHLPTTMVDDKTYYLPGITLIIWLFWVQSAYILGGTLFRKQPFIFTSLSLFFLSSLVFGGLSFIEDHVSYSINLGEDVAYVILGILCIIGVVLFVVNYYLSYKIFHRMQVINNKWINAF